jgi:glutathione S-transferase
MLTLYHAPRSRSSRFVFLLEELGAPYEIVYVGIRRGDGSGARDSRNPHPEGKVPTLVHDGALVSESAAIALYLTDLYPDAGLGPRVGDADRGAYLTWLAYYAGVIEPAIAAKFRGLTDTDPAEKASYEAFEQRLISALEAWPYLLGERFSAADILIFSLLQFAPQLAPQGSAIDAYKARIAERPALARALVKDQDDAPADV